jgi:hypothetical protein
MILKCLKQKQKRMRMQESEDLMKKAGALAELKRGNNKSTKYLEMDKVSEISKTSFSPEVIRAFENIFAKYDSVIKGNYEQKLEEITVTFIFITINFLI